jgi:hypothetical protein
MSNADFLGRAIETVKKAIETDTAGEYEKAYQMYYSARECPTKPTRGLHANMVQWSCLCSLSSVRLPPTKQKRCLYTNIKATR